MKNPHKALEAIERLVGGNFGMEMEYLIYEKRKKIDPQLLDAAKVITQIYCIVHSETSHSCSHPTWEQEKYKILATPEV